MKVTYALPERLVRAVLARYGFKGWCLEQAFIVGYNHAQRSQPPQAVEINSDTHRAYLIGYQKGQV